MPTTWETNLENREAAIDRDARQAPPFRAGKDSADGEAVQTQFVACGRHPWPPSVNGQ